MATVTGYGSDVPRSQKPIELILARNFLAALQTPAFLVDREGDVIFYNEAAGVLLGRRFEEAGRMAAGDWTARFGPFDDSGRPIPVDHLPITHALRGNRPAHAVFHIRALDGTAHEIESSAVPIVGADGFHGAITIFWPRGVDAQ